VDVGFHVEKGDTSCDLEVVALQELLCLRVHHNFTWLNLGEKIGETEYETVLKALKHPVVVFVKLFCLHEYLLDDAQSQIHFFKESLGDLQV
jgi:hypothetical protein